MKALGELFVNVVGMTLILRLLVKNLGMLEESLHETLDQEVDKSGWNMFNAEERNFRYLNAFIWNLETAIAVSSNIKRPIYILVHVRDSRRIRVGIIPEVNRYGISQFCFKIY